MHPAAHRGRLEARAAARGRADIDQPPVEAKAAYGGLCRKPPDGIDDQMQGTIAGSDDAPAEFVDVVAGEIDDGIGATCERARQRRLHRVRRR